jgi:hypothetical protein
MSDLRTRLQEIYDLHGRLSPALVVEAARNPEDPLHSRLEWDDTVAAEKYRLEQAHELIRSVKISYRDAQGDFKEVRAFHAFRASTGGHHYVPVEKVAQDPMLSKILLGEMERDWRNLRKRWEGYTEFQQMVRRDLDAA